MLYPYSAPNALPNCGYASRVQLWSMPSTGIPLAFALPSAIQRLMASASALSGPAADARLALSAMGDETGIIRVVAARADAGGKPLDWPRRSWPSKLALIGPTVRGSNAARGT